MKVLRRDARETQERLLEAAGVVFAAKGFGKATVAEICKRAKANVASVNYHFGSKKELYIEAWRHEFKKSIDAHPPDGGIPPDAPVEQRLHGRILSILQRILDPESLEFDIFHREHASPTGLLAEAARESIEPIRKGLTKIVRELLGSGTGRQAVRLCRRSIMSQCFGIMIHERRRNLAPPGISTPGPPPLEVGVEALAGHITRFCLAGIRDARKRAGGKKLRKKGGR